MPFVSVLDLAIYPKSMTLKKCLEMPMGRGEVGWRLLVLLSNSAVRLPISFVSFSHSFLAYKMADTTLIIHHTFSAVALIVMAARIVARLRIFGKFDTGDYLTIAAIICAAARTGLIHVVLTWGTNNLSAAARARINFTDEEVYRRTIGSKFTIANRPIYNT